MRHCPAANLRCRCDAIQPFKCPGTALRRVTGVFAALWVGSALATPRHHICPLARLPPSHPAHPAHPGQGAMDYGVDDVQNLLLLEVPRMQVRR